MREIKCYTCGSKLECVEWSCSNKDCDDGLFASSKLWAKDWLRLSKQNTKLEIEYTYVLLEMLGDCHAK